MYKHYRKIMLAMPVKIEKGGYVGAIPCVVL